MFEKATQGSRQRGRGTAGLASDRWPRGRNANRPVPSHRHTPDAAGSSWSRSTWRACGLCRRELMCLVDGRLGVVAWVCTQCDA